MGYLDVRYAPHSISLHFAGEMWIFCVLTVLLLGLTVGSWLWVERRRRQRDSLWSRSRTNDSDRVAADPEDEC